MKRAKHSTSVVDQATEKYEPLDTQKWSHSRLDKKHQVQMELEESKEIPGKATLKERREKKQKKFRRAELKPPT